MRGVSTGTLQVSSPDLPIAPTFAIATTISAAGTTAIDLQPGSGTAIVSLSSMIIGVAASPLYIWFGPTSTPTSPGGSTVILTGNEVMRFIFGKTSRYLYAISDLNTMTLYSYVEGRNE